MPNNKLLDNQRVFMDVSSTTVNNVYRASQAEIVFTDTLAQFPNNSEKCWYRHYENSNASTYTSCERTANKTVTLYNLKAHVGARQLEIRILARFDAGSSSALSSAKTYVDSGETIDEGTNLVTLDRTTTY